MAVAFNSSDARRPTAGTTISFSYTSSAGSDRLLLSGTNGEGVTVNSGTYAGASLTNSGSASGFIIWSKAGNASGANTLAFTLSGYGTARVVTSDWTGVDQTTPVGTSVSNSATSASITTGSITCPSSGGVWGMCNTGYQGGSPSLVAGTGTTLASTATRNGTAYGGGYRLDTGALNWTQGASTAYTAIGIPINAAAASGTASITAAAGTATASTLAGSSTAATTVTAAAGAATASSIAGASTAVASFTQADGVATAETLQGSSGSSAITQAGGTATAATMAGASVAAAAITQADGVGSGATMQGSDAAAPVVVTTRRVAGGRAVRKRYLIRGKFYWLTDDELSVLIAQELADISRREVKVAAPKAKPRVISAEAWAAVKPLARLEALAERMEDDSDDEDELILMMV